MAKMSSSSGFTVSNTLALSSLTLSFVVGEFSHFIIVVVSRDMARDVGFGNSHCYAKDIDIANASNCQTYSKESCLNSSLCEWLYNGQGIEYQVLAGPIFIIISTLSGILLGYLGDQQSRCTILSICILLYSLSSVIMAFAQAYWHLAVLRIGMAIGLGAVRPLGSALIADLFDVSWRGLAIGIFSLSTYLGFGLAFALGNYVTFGIGDGNKLGSGWRATFLIGCAVGIPLSIAVFFIKDPRSSKKQVYKKSKKQKDYWKRFVSSFFQPTLLLVLLAASVRHTGGFAWIYNGQLYFQEYYPGSPPGLWMSVSAIVGGCFGVFGGGYLSDLVVKRLGAHARMWMLSIFLALATPFAVLILALDPPEAFYMIMAFFVLAETWMAILITIVVEIVSVEVRAACLGIFLFVMNNVGGNLPTAIEPFIGWIGLRNALYIFFPGCIGSAAILFFLSSLPLYMQKKSRAQSVPNEDCESTLTK